MKRRDGIEELAISRLVDKDDVVPAFQRDEFRARNAGSNLLSLTEWHTDVATGMHDQGWHAHRRQQVDDIDAGVRAEDPFCHFGRGGDTLNVIESPVMLDGAVRTELRREEFPV